MKKKYKEKVKDFIERKRKYYRNSQYNDKFFSDKYNFLFGLNFVNEINQPHSGNCYYFEVEGFNDVDSIMKELEVEISDGYRNRISKLYHNNLNNAKFPCLIVLCDKTVEQR